jgi:hypothetical protein
MFPVLSGVQLMDLFKMTEDSQVIIYTVKLLAEDSQVMIYTVIRLAEGFQAIL